MKPFSSGQPLELKKLAAIERWHDYIETPCFLAIHSSVLHFPVDFMAHFISCLTDTMIAPTLHLDLQKYDHAVVVVGGRGKGWGEESETDQSDHASPFCSFGCFAQK